MFRPWSWWVGRGKPHHYSSWWVKWEHRMLPSLNLNGYILQAAVVAKKPKSWASEFLVDRKLPWVERQYEMWKHWLRFFQKNEYPWVVSLMDDNSDHFCGGALVASKYVLTAAHCLFDDIHRFGVNSFNKILPSSFKVRSYLSSIYDLGSFEIKSLG